jgi:hypothetical protein
MSRPLKNADRRVKNVPWPGLSRAPLQRGVAFGSRFGCYDAIVNPGSCPGRVGIGGDDASETFAEQVKVRFLKAAFTSR